MKKTLYLIILLELISCQPKTNEQKGNKTDNTSNVSIAFYNLENLFDTIDSPIEGDGDWTPTGRKGWNTQRYKLKLEKLAYVISNLNGNNDSMGPDILGVSEVENRSVLNDLVSVSLMKKSNYGIIHFESPDHRGIDVGFLYRKKTFEPKNFRNVKLEDYKTRDQLVVSGLLQGELIHIIVNHWPSRRGGAESSEIKRLNAAKLTKSIIDSIYNTNSKAKIVVMGDFNDNPSNKSITKILSAKGNSKDVKETDFFNPMSSLLTPTRGSLCYKSNWFLFDQILFSPYWFNSKGLNFSYANIFDSEEVKVDKGKYKGYPLRTHAGKLYLKGYSDHFAVYTIVE